MVEEIAQLIFNYIKEKRKIDIFFINEIIKITIKYYQLEEYIKDIKPLIHKKSYAQYNSTNKTIYINYQKVTEYLEIAVSNTNFKNSVSYKYILFIQILLHEVMHAKQYKQSIEYQDTEDILFLQTELLNLPNKSINEHKNPESIILHEEFSVSERIAKGIQDGSISIFKGFMQVIKIHRTYKKLYEFSPTERLANIDSAKIAADIATKLNDEQSTLLMLLIHYESYLNGYNIGMVRCNSDEPTKYYLDSIHSNEKWSEILELSTNLSQIERIRLGLKSNQDELQQIAHKTNKLLLALNKK